MGRPMDPQVKGAAAVSLVSLETALGWNQVVLKYLDCLPVPWIRGLFHLAFEKLEL